MKKNLTKSVLSMASVLLVGVSPIAVSTSHVIPQVFAQEEDPGENLIIEYIKADAKEIKGQTVPGATVTAFNERTSDKETVDADEKGNFAIPTAEFEIKEDDIINFTAGTLDNQTYFRTVKVESIAKELRDETSAETTVEEQKSEPIVISEPINFITDANGNHTLKVSSVTAEDKTVKGTTFSEGTVTLFIPKTGEKVTVDADKDGNFEITLPEGTQLSQGDELHLTSLSNDIQTLDYIEVTVA